MKGTVWVAVLALFASAPLWAEDDNTEDLVAAMATRADGQDCINLRSIRNTKIANDKTILFYLNRKQIFMNVLPHKCPGLRREKRFMYRTTGNRLCDLDAVTVLDDIGFGFSRGPTCGLGVFYPISKDDAAALMERGNK